MPIEDDMVEVAFWDVWRRIIKPWTILTDPRIPDPSVNFDGCIDAVFDVMTIECASLPPAERSAWILQKAIDAVELAREYDFPHDMKARATAWRRRLLN